MNNRKENEQSCIVMNKKEGASCITTHLLSCARLLFHLNNIFKIYLPV